MKSALLLFLFLQLTVGYSQNQNKNNIIAPSNEGSSNMVAGSAAAKNLTATPAYPGGNEAFLDFISKNLSYPETAVAHSTEGRVIVRFQVDADGSVKNALVPKGMGIGNGCDEEAIRVVMLSQKWKPGMRMGTQVSMWYEVPIVFALTDKK